jgi:uncharacterized RmlC-like cupin family protein
MIVSEAEFVVQAMLAPLTVESFFDAVRSSKPVAQKGGPSHPRAALLGPDPEATLLAAFATHAPILDCHATAPIGPPPGPAVVPSPAAFRALVDRYHDRGYTVRIPEVRALASPLLGFTRALEALICQPVEASVFWSRAGARAKIHYDNNDNITVQLVGRKRWYISTDPAGLQNAWGDVAEPLPHLERHRVLDVEPGDLHYVPRGTPHSVESTTDSLHVSILFTPLTLRSAIMAALDHASDTARPYRVTAASRLVGVPRLGAALGPGIVAALTHLVDLCREPDFVDAALARRMSRGIGDLARLTPVNATLLPLAPASRVRHAPLSTVHLRNAGNVVDLALPGGHVPIHAGAAPALAFIAATTSFAISDLPGLAPEVSMALVERLVSAGLLEPEI